MKSFREELEGILELECGQTCPNGAENNKPSLKKIIKLALRASLESIGEDEKVFGAHDLTPYIAIEAKNEIRKKIRERLKNIFGG